MMERMPSTLNAGRQAIFLNFSRSLYQTFQPELTPMEALLSFQFITMHQREELAEAQTKMETYLLVGS